MIVGKVVGNVWATRKDDGLNGLKLLVIKPIDHYEGKLLPELIAADCVGAGIGEEVLVVTGSSARKSSRVDEVPIDAMVVGIVDNIDIDRTIEISEEINGLT